MWGAAGVLAIAAMAAVFAIGARPAEEKQDALEAARLNGIGVALMNQQLTEKAAAKLAEG